MRARRPHLSTRIDKTSSPAGCWLWTGHINGSGYGTMGGRSVHRLVYIELVGPIPDGLQLDHLCRIRNCVNPAHLEPVTAAENVRRGDGPGGRNARKTHCKNGHTLTPENVYIRRGRNCRICARARNDVWRGAA